MFTVLRNNCTNVNVKYNKTKCIICPNSFPQEEVIQLLTQQQLEVSVQLCGQALHGNSGQGRLL